MTSGWLATTSSHSKRSEPLCLSPKQLTPPAKVTISGPQGETTTQTNDQGVYKVEALIPGTYTVTVEQAGFKTHVSQVYTDDDPNLETDSQFGVTRRLIGHYVLHENEPAPAPDVKGPWYSLDHTFVLEPGQTRLPRPPITAKASGERPKIPHLA